MARSFKFNWKHDDEGQVIEDFLVTLCTTVPDVAIEILRLGFGDLSGWYNDAQDGNVDTSWRNAPCGCLVGQSAIIATKKVPGCVALIETHPDDEGDERGDAPFVLYMALAAATKRNIHQYRRVDDDPLYQTIFDVGCKVGGECEPRWEDTDVTVDERTEEVGQYLLDFIRTALTLMGHTKLPKSPTCACNLSDD